MAALNHKPRLAIVSPFLDKSHGTERMVVEWIKNLEPKFEIHIYSQSVSDIDLSKVTWHRIRKLKCPHIVNFTWWFVANRLWRAWDRSRGLKYDLVFSPGVNCLDADAVSVHIVFAEFIRRVSSELRLSKHNVFAWPRLLHRILYYRMIVFLEHIVFTNPNTQLILTATQTADELERLYGRRGDFPVLSTGLDHATFNPIRRFSLRESARTKLGLARERFAILLVGNDWRKKGLPTLLEAAERLPRLPIELLVVGRDDPGPFLAMILDRDLRSRVRFLPPRKDIEFYYAASDVYVGPSLEDTFALPAAEAMACGLPVIISARAGASALVTHGVNGMILHDPTDGHLLATMIEMLWEDDRFRVRLGETAAETTRPYTWEQSSSELAVIFEDILRRKYSFSSQTLTQKP